MRPFALFPLRNRAAVWVSLPLVVAVAWRYVDYSPAASRAYWPALLTQPAVVLQIAVPVLAAALAWDAGRLRFARVERQTVPARGWFGLFWWTALPAVVTLALLYIGLVGFETLRAGLPVSSWPDPLAIAAVLGSCVTGLTLGYLLGRLLPRAFAVPLAGLGLLGLVLGPQVADAGRLRNLLGFSVADCCTYFDLRLESGAAASAVLCAVALVLISAAVLGSTARRVVPLSAAVLAIAALVGAGWVAPATQSPPGAIRSLSELRCTGGHPEICQWPEWADSARGHEFEDVIRAAYDSAENLGVELPPRVSAIATSSDTVEFGDVRGTPDVVRVALAHAVVAGSECDPNSYDDYDRMYQRAIYGLAIAFGADETAALPSLYAPTDARNEPVLLPPEQIRQYLDVPDLTAATAAYQQWRDASVGCSTEEKQ